MTFVDPTHLTRTATYSLSEMQQIDKESREAELRGDMGWEPRNPTTIWRKIRLNLDGVSDYKEYIDEQTGKHCTSVWKHSGENLIIEDSFDDFDRVYMSYIKKSNVIWELGN